MLEDLALGFSHLLTSPLSITVFVVALIGGLIFGAIPGVDEMTLATIALPFTAFLPAPDAIMFFGVLYVSGVYGGAITAILFNVPGSADNAPTAFDGYPMTLRGESGKAIGAAVTCSAIGGTASAILMIIATEPLAKWAIRAFGPPELFALIIFGLCISATVGTQSTWKAWLSVLLGLLIGSVGTEPASSFPRFTFGTDYLAAGIQFIPLILGFFAVSEVFTQGHKIASGLHLPAKIGIDFPAFSEFWRLRFAIIRSTVVGFLAGVLPGIGSTLAAFMSYGVAVRRSRHPERFGKGELEGVVASETANNAATGGAMIPLLALGLPGGALTAVMIGAFQIHGIEPGPLVLVNSKELVWTVFAAMLVANISIFALGYLETKIIVQLLRVPFSILGPMILLLAVLGSYSLRNLTIDIWVTFIAGIVGFVLRRSGYSTAGIVIGVILGNLGESSFVTTMQMLDYNPLNFVNHPIAAVLLVLGIAAIVASGYSAIQRSRRYSAA